MTAHHSLHRSSPALHRVGSRVLFWPLIRTCDLIGIMHRVDHLTDTQERILRCIRGHIAAHGEVSTITQIGAAVGLGSRASVHYQLGELEAKHAIVREPGQRRGIRLA
ncbi:LexA family protein [Streptomyces sp. NPDC003273]|uniref:LexA family protein n=1 Tax=Streptomyces sp. NPDC003273 TaxID=3364678 RepID=UPI0036A8FDE5